MVGRTEELSLPLRVVLAFVAQRFFVLEPPFVTWTVAATPGARELEAAGVTQELAAALAVPAVRVRRCVCRHIPLDQSTRSSHQCDRGVHSERLRLTRRALLGAAIRRMRSRSWR